MNPRIKTPQADHFMKAVLTLKTLDEAYQFFEDVCTVNELQSIAQRFAVATMLKEGETYMEIASKTGASTATISRVNRSLNFGNNSYEMVLGRMSEEGEF